MGRIAILPDAVADQIAAGEVVERPASVVKELVENALDAGATEVAVDLDDGGMALIRVSDDGVGMDPDDARLAVSRHATSKIRSAGDLVGVPTYGFRGEALAAVASVSHFELETATAGAVSGTRVRVTGGRLETVELVARQPGTTVTVRRLFFNTPARRKFLRTARGETRAALESVIGLALARLDVAFRVTADGRVALDAPRVADIEERIAALFGRKFAGELVPVSGGSGAISIAGFVQRPSDARASGRKAYLFVNGRPFRDPFLVRAAEAGFKGTIDAGVRPSVILSIGVPGNSVDVNVHPAKLEVRFRDRFLVERVAEETVRAALRPMEASALLRGADAAGPASADVVAADHAVAQAVLPMGWRGTAAPGGPGPQETLPIEATGAPAGGTGLGDPIQIFDTYLVFETPEGLAIVDQHSAHERVLFERTMAELSGGGAAAQHLLLPLTLDLGPEELEVVEAQSDLLRSVGYTVEPFGGRSIVVHTVPNPHPRFDARRCLEELVADLARGRFGAWANRLERFAATFACRAAIKAGHRLTVPEMRDLLSRLMASHLPPHDVHGRPTIVQLPRAELERRFGRA
ncbi:MAG TPA: DNA mismatch repair endonuclease MutL [Gemmatimonadales bacterium]|nr:DNA mismatch repair endonuclease MutL [Gemmatimonadales bacterium]